MKNKQITLIWKLISFVCGMFELIEPLKLKKHKLHSTFIGSTVDIGFVSMKSQPFVRVENLQPLLEPFEQ